MHIFWKQIKLKWKLSEPFYMRGTNPTEPALMVRKTLLVPVIWSGIGTRK
jgi:hypothetical protein